MTEASDNRAAGRFRRKNSNRRLDPRCLIGRHKWGAMVIDHRHCLRDCGASKHIGTTRAGFRDP